MYPDNLGNTHEGNEVTEKGIIFLESLSEAFVKFEEEIDKELLDSTSRIIESFSKQIIKVINFSEDRGIEDVMEDVKRDNGFLREMLGRELTKKESLLERRIKMKNYFSEELQRKINDEAERLYKEKLGELGLDDEGEAVEFVRKALRKN